MFKITRYYHDRKFENFYDTTEKLQKAVAHFIECNQYPGDKIKRFEVDFHPTGDNVPKPLNATKLTDL